MSIQQEHIKTFDITRSKPSEIEIYLPLAVYSSCMKMTMAYRVGEPVNMFDVRSAPYIRY